MNTIEFKQKFRAISPVLLRLGLAAVMLWFGFSQLQNPNAWTSLVPDWALSLSHVTALTFVFMNGAFEVIAGSLIALGVLTRPLGLLLAIHLFVITADLGASAIGVRDFGLSIAMLVVAMNGSDEFSLL
jgi:uncharacterized membrane protein YphA (DoxX/SURF4 family)